MDLPLDNLGQMFNLLLMPATDKWANKCAARLARWQCGDGGIMSRSRDSGVGSWLLVIGDWLGWY
jgi:hypothetical protein